MKRFITLVTALIGLADFGTASAGDFTPVDFSSQANWTWAGYDSGPGLPSGVFLPGAPTGTTTLGGIPFDIKSNESGYQAWNSYLADDEGSDQVSLTMNVDAYSVTNVYTLLNTFWGQPGPDSYASLIFTGTGSASYTDNLVGDVDIRDYNDGPSINGTTTTNVFSDTDINDSTGFLDMQNIALPSAFANQTLTTIELVDDGAPRFQRSILDGVTVEVVPEPSSIVLSAFGILGIALFVWGRRWLNRTTART